MKTLRDAKSKFIEIEFADPDVAKLVFKRADILKQTEQILTDNGIRFQAAPKELLKLWEGKTE